MHNMHGLVRLIGMHLVGPLRVHVHVHMHMRMLIPC